MTIRTGLAEWVRMSEGVQEPVTAMGAGRLRVEGAVILLARLESLFGAA